MVQYYLLVSIFLLLCVGVTEINLVLVYTVKECS
jgi:hypothetical protein